MYILQKGSTNKANAFSFYILDYIKTKALLFNLSILNGKLIPQSQIPTLLLPFLNKMSAKESQEVLFYVDFIFELDNFTSKMSKFSSISEKVIYSFPNIDISLFSKKEFNGILQKIFKEYPSTKEALNYILNLRKDFLKSKNENKLTFEMLNFKEVFSRLTQFTSSNDFMQFITDFENINSYSLAKRIEDKFLQSIPNEEIFFSKAFPTAIFDKKNGIIHPIFYNAKSTKTNGMISHFSTFIYNLLFLNELEADSNLRTYLNDIKQIHNRCVLDKIFHLHDTNERLSNFLDTLATKDYAKKLIENKSNIKELIKAIDENIDIFSDDSKDSIFVIYMLVDFKQKIKNEQNSIKKEIRLILDKKLPLEIKFAEIEIYLQSIVYMFLDNKRIESYNNEFNEMFYNSIKIPLRNIILDIFNEYDENSSNNKALVGVAV